MQDIKKYCLIDQICEEKIRIVVFDESYKVIQYKFMDFNKSKLHNIYCGIIRKIDYGIESIFVSLESGLYGFLSFKHLNRTYYDKNCKKLIKTIKKGDKLLVQVIRDSLDKKLLKLTNNIVISGQFCVYLPFDDCASGISFNIKADQRVMLKAFLNDLKKEEDGSLIIRTSGAISCLDEIKNDYYNVLKLFNEINNRFKNENKAKILFKYDELIYVFRSYSSFLLESVFVRDVDLYNKVVGYSQDGLIKFPEINYSKNFEFLDKLDEQIKQLYKREVKLPSKGSIIIEKTEALISIDVNSNNNKNESNMEMTAFNTNLEAAYVIIDQVILRNLGGIIVIDLIDMKDENHIKIINDVFKHGFKNDKSSIKIVPINALCVLQISRERKGLSLMDKSYVKCDNCECGYVKSMDLCCFDLFYELSKYSYEDCLKVSIKSELFKYVHKYHLKTIKKYKKLKWDINEIANVKIIKCK